MAVEGDETPKPVYMYMHLPARILLVHAPSQRLTYMTLYMYLYHACGYHAYCLCLAGFALMTRMLMSVGAGRVAMALEGG